MKKDPKLQKAGIELKAMKRIIEKLEARDSNDHRPLIFLHRLYAKSFRGEARFEAGQWIIILTNEYAV